MKNFINITKKNNILILITALLFGLFFYYSYTYKFVYDDLSWSYILSFSFKIFFERFSHMYLTAGRPMSAIFLVSYDVPFLYSLISSASILLMFGYIPLLAIRKTISNNNISLSATFIFCFAVTSLLSLLFPFQSVVYHDFFIRIMFILYTLPTVIIAVIAMVFWSEIFLDKSLKLPKILYVVLVPIVIIVSVSDIHGIYILAIAFGILILRLIRYQQFPKFQINSMIISSIILVFLIFSLTSPGLYKGMTEGIYKSSTLLINIKTLLKSTGHISFILLCSISFIFILLYIRDRKKVFHSEYIWQVVFLLCIYMGLISIFIIAKPPYYRIPLIALLNYPLIIAMLLLLYILLSPYSQIFRYLTIVNIGIIVYSLYVTNHNIILKNKTMTYIEQIFQNTPEDATEIFLPNFKYNFLHGSNIFSIGGNYSDFLHSFRGDRREYEKLGGKYFIQVMRPDTDAFQDGHRLYFDLIYPQIRNKEILLSTNIVYITN
ncbi:MAG: hypothetical protein ACRC9L_00935 [Brevinema sp.]